MAAAVSGLSPVIITVRMPIARSWSKRSVMPGLTVSLRRITPRMRGGSPSRRSVTTSGVAPSREIAVDDRQPARAARRRPPPRRAGAPSRRRPCGRRPAAVDREVHPAHAGLGGERHQHGASGADGSTRP